MPVCACRLLSEAEVQEIALGFLAARAFPSLAQLPLASFSLSALEKLSAELPTNWIVTTEVQLAIVPFVATIRRLRDQCRASALSFSVSAPAMGQPSAEVESRFAALLLRLGHS